jgi:hypothetical protein
MMPPFSQNFITFQKIKNINHYSSKRYVQARAKHIVFGHFSGRFLLIFLPFLCRVRRNAAGISHIAAAGKKTFANGVSKTCSQMYFLRSYCGLSCLTYCEN